MLSVVRRSCELPDEDARVPVRDIYPECRLLRSNGALTIRILDGNQGHDPSIHHEIRTIL